MADDTLYAAEAEYATYLGIEGELDEQRLAELTDACRVWDLLCRVPAGWFAPETATARAFDVSNPYELWVGALASSSGVVVKIDQDGDRTFETTLDASLDYFLEPVDGPPFTSIVIDRSNGRYTFPVGRRRAQVTAKHGWAESAPGPVRRAVLLIAKRYGVRVNTPEGIKDGASEHMMRLAAQDPDVVAILASGAYRQATVFA